MYGYANGKFGQVHYYDTGTTARPLILCHQSPMTLRQFEAVYPLFQQAGVRAIGIDMPGFGNSDSTPATPTIADYATIIPSVLDHLKIDSASICGHHTGALLATEASILWPDRVNRVVLNGPSPLNEEERNTWLEYTRVNEQELVHETDGQHLADVYQRRWQWADEDCDPALVTRYVVETFMGRAPFWYGHHAAFSYDHEERLKQMTHPTLILTNSGDIIYDLAQRAREIRPDFEYHCIEGGKIDIVDQLPEEWTKIVAEFICQ